MRGFVNKDGGAREGKEERDENKANDGNGVGEKSILCKAIKVAAGADHTLVLCLRGSIGEEGRGSVVGFGRSQRGQSTGPFVEDRVVETGDSSSSNRGGTGPFTATPAYMQVKARGGDISKSGGIAYIAAARDCSLALSLEGVTKVKGRERPGEEGRGGGGVYWTGRCTKKLKERLLNEVVAE